MEFLCHEYGGLSMERFRLVDKLKDKANISYEEAKTILEENNWDILDSMIYLEEIGRVKKPSVSVFYTNDYKESYEERTEIVNITDNKKGEKSRGKNNFEGIFETVCKYIDSCNNILIEIIRKNTVILRIPLTVVILLLLFTFWITIPLIIVGLFFDIEFYISAKKVNADKINKVLSEISKNIKDVKEKIKKRFNNG